MAGASGGSRASGLTILWYIYTDRSLTDCLVVSRHFNASAFGTTTVWSTLNLHCHQQDVGSLGAGANALLEEFFAADVAVAQ